MCMKRREWDETQAAEMAADELNAKRLRRAVEMQAQLDCLHCDDDGWILGEDGTPAEPAMKCQIHNVDAKAVAHA